MRTLISVTCVLAIGMAVGCSDQGSGSEANITEQKLEASKLYKSGNPANLPKQDLCQLHGWYGDGVCDAWCPQGDPTDCGGASDAGFACPALASLPDGKCDPKDPCSGVTDPDCKGGAADAGLVACPAYLSVPNGKCELTGPCAPYNDPDCKADAGIACTAIYSLPDGKCDRSDPCSQYQDADCQADAGGGVACPATHFPTDGSCEAPTGCESLDADCGGSGAADAGIGHVVCPLYVSLPDGVCSLTGPCAAINDPDCKSTGGGTSAGQTCGGIAALECATGFFCDYAQGQGCNGNVADAAGVCSAIPQVCTLQYSPVCGCDGHTYDNECTAHAAGAAVNHSGACS